MQECSQLVDAVMLAHACSLGWQGRNGDSSSNECLCERLADSP